MSNTIATCKRNHELTTDNIYVNPRGDRECRACRKLAVNRGYQKHRDTKLFGGNREVVIQRDGEKCVTCGMTRNEHREKHDRDITVDHIDGRGLNTPRRLKNNNLDNLQTLCMACHGKKDIVRRTKWGSRIRKGRNQ